MRESNRAEAHASRGAGDVLTEILRGGARELLRQAVEAELASHLEAWSHLRLETGQQRVVRHGHGPARSILTGIGPVSVRRPKTRDRGASGEDRIRFSSAILPRFARRTKSLDAVLPTLYLRGVSTGDFGEALSALVGAEAPGLGPGVIGRLKAAWAQDHDRWQRRDLSDREYVYVWADGIYLRCRLEEDRQCVLVLLGATASGRKELLGFQTGFRESGQSWRELLEDLRGRGLREPPRLAVGDGALGFWSALEKVFPGTAHQRCWVHKTANVLNALPKSRRANAKRDLHQIWMAADRREAERALKTFSRKYGAKYPKAVRLLEKDRKTLLAFYDFPAEHWRHIRTTNPIESVFATVRHRTVRSKGCLSHRTARTMVFQLVMAASRSWRLLNGSPKLPLVLEGVKFKDGQQADDTEIQAAA